MTPATLTAPAATGVEITVPLAAFRDALDRVTVAVPSRTTLPELQCILVTAEPETLTAAARVTLLATDIDRFVEATVQAEDPGAVRVSRALSVLLPADILKAATQNADAGAALSLAVPAAGHATLRVGKTRYKVPTIAGERMPEGRAMAQPAHFGITAGQLQRAMRRLTYACSTEVSRPIMQGVHVAPMDGPEPGVSIVAGDGRRVVEVRLPLALGLEADAIIPRNAAEAMERVFDASELVALQADGGTLAVTSATRRLRTRLIEGPYPNLRGYMRTTSALRVTFDRAALVAGIKRVAFLADSDLLRVALTIEPADGTLDGVAYQCRLRTTTPDRGAAVDVVPCAADGAVPTDAPFTIACGAGFLLGALTKTLTGATVVLGLDTPKLPLVFTDPDDPRAFAVVGPLNIPADAEA